MSVADAIRDEQSLPRRNGELVFDAPWQSRAFSVAVALADSGRCDWEQFRSRLIAEIGDWERAHPPAADGEPDPAWDYYAHWLAALERLLLEEGLVSGAELTARADRLREHDAHEHDHDGHPHEH